MAELDIRGEVVSEIDTIRFSVDDIVSKRCCYTGVFCIASDGAVPIETEEDEPSIAYLYIKDIPNLIKALQKAQELWGVDNK